MDVNDKYAYRAEFNEKFLAHVGVLCQNPGSRAELRRMAGRDPFEEHRALILLRPFRTSNKKLWPVRVTVAALYAAHGKGIEGDGLGDAIRRAYPAGAPLSVVQALDKLADADKALCLSDLLPNLVALLASKQAVPDMSVLLDDLGWWHHNSRRQVFRWTESSLPIQAA